MANVGAHPVVRQLVCFGIIGVVGFVVDSAALLACMRWLGSGLYLSRCYSFLVAATVTWALNRQFTFRSRSNALFREWAQFLLANSVGGLANLGTYFALTATFPWVAAHPVVAVAAGSIAGLAWNFTLSSRWVFRDQ